MFIDLIFILLMLMAVVKGLQRGLIVAVFSMIGFVVGLIAAVKFSTVVAAWLNDSINVSARWLPFLSFVLVFIVVILLIRLLAKLVESTIELAMLGWVNKIGGAMMYAVIYILIFSVILFYAVELNLIDPDTLENSTTYRFIKPVGPFVIDGIGTLIPWFRDMFEELRDFFTRLSEKAPLPKGQQ